MFSASSAAKYSFHTSMQNYQRPFNQHHACSLLREFLSFPVQNQSGKWISWCLHKLKADQQAHVIWDDSFNLKTIPSFLKELSLLQHTEDQKRSLIRQKCCQDPADSLPSPMGQKWAGTRDGLTLRTSEWTLVKCPEEGKNGHRKMRELLRNWFRRALWLVRISGVMDVAGHSLP